MKSSYTSRKKTAWRIESKYAYTISSSAVCVLTSLGRSVAIIFNIIPLFVHTRNSLVVVAPFFLFFLFFKRRAHIQIEKKERKRKNKKKKNNKNSLVRNE